MSRLSGLSGSLVATRSGENRLDAHPEQNVFQIGARPSYASLQGATASGSLAAVRPRTTSTGSFGRVNAQDLGGSVGLDSSQSLFGNLGTQAHEQELSRLNSTLGNANGLVNAIQSYNDALTSYRSGLGFNNTSGSGFRITLPPAEMEDRLRDMSSSLAGQLGSVSGTDYSPEWNTFSEFVSNYGSPYSWTKETGRDYLTTLAGRGVAPQQNLWAVDPGETYGIGGAGTNPYSFGGLTGSLPGIRESAAYQTSSYPTYSPWTNSPVNWGWGSANRFYIPDAPLPYGGYGNRFAQPGSQEYTVDTSRDLQPTEYRYVPGVERSVQPGQRESFGNRDPGQYVPIQGASYSPPPEINLGNIGEGYVPLRWQQGNAPTAGTPFTERAYQAGTPGTPSSQGTRREVYGRYDAGIRNNTRQYTERLLGSFPTSGTWQLQTFGSPAHSGYVRYYPDGSSRYTQSIAVPVGHPYNHYQVRQGTYTIPGTPGTPAVPGIYRSLP